MYKIPPYIPIIFHNLSGYDAHLFIKELAALTDGRDSKMGLLVQTTTFTAFVVHQRSR